MGYKSYTTEDIDMSINIIFDKISKEGKSLRSCCRELQLPLTTVYDWIEKNKSYSEQYARCREDRADLIFEDILNIADGNGQDTRVNDYGDQVVDHDVVQRARLRIDARKWMLGKMQPKKYGDKLDIDHKIEGSKSVKIVFGDESDEISEDD